MKVLEQKNLFVYIYSDDHSPAHVHIFVGRKNEFNKFEIKITIGNGDVLPQIVKAYPKMKGSDKRAAWELVIEHQEYLLKLWQEIHGI